MKCLAEPDGRQWASLMSIAEVNLVHLFALMHQLLPEQLAPSCTGTALVFIRVRGKSSQSWCQFVVKLQADNKTLLAQVLLVLRQFHPPPI